MAFPVVEATETSQDDTSDTDKEVTLPAGVAAGDLLIVVVNTKNFHTHSWPAGWNEIVDEKDNTNFATSLSVGWRKATGGESTVTVTLDSAGRSCFNAYRISGMADPSSQPPEALGIEGGAVSANPNPPDLTPTGGAKDYLWIAACSTSSSDVTAAPTNYTTLLSERGATFGNDCASSRRELNAASENPDGFTALSDAWIAATIAVHPVAAGGGGTRVGVAA